MSEVRLNKVSKRYGDYVAVAGIDLTVRNGEFLTLLGPSGCGKTTTLRMIAGFIQPDQGTIHIGDTDVSRVPSYRRNTGMVFQSYALFPHLTVAENVAFGLRIRRMADVEVRQRVREILQLVKLDHLAERGPRQLSGGQQQRVALARAVVIRPEILLLDEPLGALDLKLRQELQIEIKRVQQTLGITTLYVTHDQGEALSLSDRIAVMQGGHVLQLDKPIALYEQPNSAFVANFIGQTNMIDVTVVGYDAGGGSTEVRAVGDPSLTFQVKERSGAPKFAPGTSCILGFRPERGTFNADLPNRLRARVEKSTYYGSAWSVSLASPLVSGLSIEDKGSHGIPADGAEIDVTWSAADSFLLPKQTA
ncbi:MAG: ABC transporter ATP-binding protein [Alphaproteobacteria bacterium]|nr:ABC transporter ATP-binding protein [Alphaproteobacteria bacterium]